MEWDALLVDLESRFEAERRADIAAQAADLAEAEVAAVRLADRLRGAVGRTIRLRTRGGTPVDGVLARAEDGFVLVEEGDGLQALVPTDSLAFLEPLPGTAPDAFGRIGRIGRVGADYLDVVVDGPRSGNGQRRPPGGARPGVVTVALAALDVLRSR